MHSRPSMGSRQNSITKRDRSPKHSQQSAFNKPGGLMILEADKQTSLISSQRKALVKEQFYQSRMAVNQVTRSLSKKKLRNTSKSNSLVRLYNQLDFKAKVALNHSFLTNIKSGRNHQTFHACLQAFQNRSQERRKAKNAID